MIELTAPLLSSQITSPLERAPSSVSVSPPTAARPFMPLSTYNARDIFRSISSWIYGESSERSEVQPFGSLIWSQETLAEMMESRSIEKLEAMGGLEALAVGLGASLKDGITGADAAYRKAKYGVNRTERSPAPSLGSLFLGAIHRRSILFSLILSMVCAIVGVMICNANIGPPCPRKPFWVGPIDVAYDSADTAGCNAWLGGVVTACGCLIVAFAAAWGVLGSEGRLRAVQCRQEGAGSVTVRRSGMAVLVQTDQVRRCSCGRNFAVLRNASC
jgi:hypothetical protein